MAQAANYVPVLKGRRGEFLALKRLRFSGQSLLTPLIEIVPPKTSRTESRKQTSLSTQIQSHATQIQQSWPIKGWPIFIDTRLMADPSLALRMLSSRLNNSILIVPVHGPERRDSHAQTVAEMVKQNPGSGVAYRIRQEELRSSKVDSHFGTFLKSCSVDPSVVDLIVDLGYIGHDDGVELRNAVVARLNSFPYIKKLRTLTVAAGSFPQDLSGVHAGRTTRRMTEWHFWQSLASDGQLLRKPRYGDYGIQCPIPSEAGGMGKANIRYASDGEWIIFRGGHLIDQKSELRNLPTEMRKLCLLAANDREVQDGDFSWADEYIRACAGNESPANDLAVWKAVGFNRHLAFVAKKLCAAF